MNKFEKYFYIALIALMLFTIGVQIGIHNGRDLERQELFQNYDQQ